MNRQTVLRSIVYVAFFIFFTFLFTLTNYPSGRLTYQVNGWILAASNGTVSVEHARVKLPLSLEVGGVTLNVGQGKSVDMGKGVVGLRFLPLLSGKRGADMRLENPWLSSRLAIVSSGEGWDLDVPSMEIDLSKLPEEIMTFPLRLKGKVGVSLNLLSEDTSRGIFRGEVRLTSGPIEMSGDILQTLGFDPLHISHILAVATVKDNVLTLGENVIEGDFTASARGAIRIAPAKYLASRLDITVELKPSEKYRQRLAPILTLMGARPRADGSINFRIRGTVGKPTVTM